MESLVPIMLSGPDVAVGVSGFGSAVVDPRRWSELSMLTGRTTYQLQYDSQRLPWVEVAPVGVAAAPLGPLPMVLALRELYRRWQVARSGALLASDHLAVWITRWCESGKSVLLVGFSLGSYVVWEAMKKVSREYWPQVDVIFVSGALADKSDQWEDVERLSSLTNAYSSSDMVLSWLYPRAVDAAEASAVGLGPIQDFFPNVLNIDLTDTIGRDHVWAGENLSSLLRTVLGVCWAGSHSIGQAPLFQVTDLNAGAIDRLSAWTLCVPSLWDRLCAALRGDQDAISEMAELDQWSLVGGRLPALMNAGGTVVSLLGQGGPAHCRPTAARSLTKIEGLVRGWLARTPRP